MKRTSIPIVIAFFLLALSSCKSKSGFFIPADALAVIHVNPSSLSSKIGWDEIKNSEWFKEMSQQANDSLAKKVLDNPEASGVDVKSDFFVFFAKQGQGGYSLFEGTLKDASAFEAVNKNAANKNKVETDGGYKFITMDNSALVVWDDKKFAFINDMPQLNAGSSFGNMRNGGGGNRSALSADSLRMLVKNVLNNKGKSLHDDDRFEGLLKESGDMHFWFNSSAAFAGMGEMMSMMKVSTLLEGNATGVTLNFDDGKISVKSKSFLNKELAKLVEKYESKNISADMLNHIPSQNVMAVMAANLNPQTIREILKAAGFDGLFNSMLSGQNFTTDDLFTAINGQFVFAVSDLQMKDTMMRSMDAEGRPLHSFKVRNPDVNILFATGVGSQPSFQKLLNIATEKMGTPPFPFKLTNQWFVAGKAQSSVDGFLSGTTVKQPWADKLTGHPFGMYIDLQRILRSDLSEDSAAKAFMLESANVWQDVTGTGGDFKNGTSTGEFVINMVDKKTNSLKQLNAFIGRANELRKTHMRRNMEEMNDDMRTDSMAAPTMKAPPAIDNNN